MKNKKLKGLAGIILSGVIGLMTSCTSSKISPYSQELREGFAPIKSEKIDAYNLEEVSFKIEKLVEEYTLMSCSIEKMSNTDKFFNYAFLCEKNEEILICFANYNKKTGLSLYKCL